MTDTTTRPSDLTGETSSHGPMRLAAGEDASLPTLLASLARDRALIPGMYETCDEWCAYCPATTRCLAFRWLASTGHMGLREPGGEMGTLSPTLVLLGALADAEARTAPPEVLTALSTDSEQQRRVLAIDDALERLGRSYMELAASCLQSRSDYPPDFSWRPDGPSPFEILTWYHVLVPARVFRAILCEREALRGIAGRDLDAVRAAKIALLGADRSLAALAAIAAEDDDPRLELLEARLRRLCDSVEARFPDARAYLRPGLDDGAAMEPAARRRPGALGWVLALLRRRHASRDIGAARRDIPPSARSAG